jgi:hypothetical protein
MSTAAQKSEVVLFPTTKAGEESPTPISKRRLDQALKSFLEKRPELNGAFSRAEILRDADIRPLIEDLARQQMAAEEREKQLHEAAEAAKAEAKRRALIKALQAETSDDEPEEESVSAGDSSPRSAQKCRVTETVSAEELLRRSEERKLREEYPMVPDLVLFVPTTIEAKISQALGLRKILFEEMNRLGEEKNLLDEAGESARAERCWKHRGWVKALVSAISGFVTSNGVRKTEWSRYFLSWDEIDRLREEVRRDAWLVGIFTSFVDDKLKEQSDRYAGVTEPAQFDRIAAMEASVRERALKTLGDDHRLFGCKAEAPLDEAIGRVEAIRFDFDDDGTFRDLSAELVDEVLIALGRKPRAVAEYTPADPTDGVESSEDRDAKRVARARAKKARAETDRQLRASMRGKSGGGGGQNNGKGKGGKKK